MSNYLIPSTYNVLRDETARVLAEGKERARLAVEWEKVRTYREVGRLLHEHVLAHKERADYGDQVIARLAEDVGMSRRLLYEILAFRRTFPIVHARAQLSWTHYRTLMKLKTGEERRFYEKEAALQGWSSRELEAQIRAEAFAEARAIKALPRPEPDAGASLPALRGELYAYRLVGARSGPGVRLDVGFGTHIVRPFIGLKDPKAGAVVASLRTPSDGGLPETYRFRIARQRRVAFYSYRANMVRVVDGDTIWLDIDCGFGIWFLQKVRLRGIDAPELPTAAGKEAKTFVEEALCGLLFVAVTTTKPDKYDRYLADIFYLVNEKDPNVVIREGIFLNRELLKAGLAKKFKS